MNALGTLHFLSEAVAKIHGFVQKTRKKITFLKKNLERKGNGLIWLRVGKKKLLRIWQEFFNLKRKSGKIVTLKGLPFSL
jgi:hypothetical protein